MKNQPSNTLKLPKRKPKKMKEIKHCEVCGKQDLELVLDLGEHPLCDDLIAVSDSRICQEYPIKILHCENCQTCHQAYQVPKRDLFPPTYHYRARHTVDVLKGMASLVENAAKHVDLKNALVLDIGCNDGSLLSIFKAEGAKTVGIDPTNACQDAKKAGHVAYQDYFDINLARQVVEKHGIPAVVTFTNVFAHIEDLDGLLKAVDYLLGPDTILIIENHYLGSVLEGNQFDTFYHEHPRTYSFTSFEFISERIGCGIVETIFPKRYGGNIRVLMRRKTDAKTSGDFDVAAIKNAEAAFHEGLQQMAISVGVWQTRKSEQLSALVDKHGSLRAKAFPGRAAILVKLLDLGIEQIDTVYEKPGSLKVGHFLPGTRIPIVSDDAFLLPPTDTRPLVNMAWHIPDEISSYMRSAGFDGEIINIVDKQDFV